MTFNINKFLWALNLALSMSLLVMSTHNKNWILVTIWSLFAICEIVLLSIEEGDKK